MSHPSRHAEIVDNLLVRPDGTIPSASSVPTPVPPPSAPAPVAKLAEVDRMALELAKERSKTALAEAKNAMSQSEMAQLNYKYVIMQLYLKYGLTDADALNEAGDILRGGALPQAQK
jgi:hypothetical protein